jgi:hypothetical protein
LSFLNPEIDTQISYHISQILIARVEAGGVGLVNQDRNMAIFLRLRLILSLLLLVRIWFSGALVCRILFTWFTAVSNSPQDAGSPVVSCSPPELVG